MNILSIPAVALLATGGLFLAQGGEFSKLAANAPSLTLNKNSYELRENIVASFTNAPGNAKDWVGIYPAGTTIDGSIPSTIWQYLDGTQAGVDVFTEGTLTFQNGLNRVGDWVAYLLEDNGYNILAQAPFTVVEPTSTATNSIALGTPIFFEDFNATPEGQLPAGWRSESHTEVLDDNTDLQDLNSKSYADWVVVSAERFRSPFLTYTEHTSTDDYLRVLSTNRLNVVNGQIVTNLATGNFVFADSGYRSGSSQVLYLFTPNFDLSGKTNVYLSFHSLYEQNQDSLGAVEYSIDGGTNWLPLLYLLHGNDVLTNESGQVDAGATFTTEYTDVAYYTDPDTGELKGGTYGSFIAAPVTEGLAPFISPRIDDDPFESKRVEYLRVAQADNQSRVRFRFAYVGTDSWYFGIDDFGLYSASSTGGGASLHATISREGNNVVISWTGGSGPFQVQKTASLSSPNWQNVTTPAGATSVTDAVSSQAAFYRVQDL